MVTNGEGLLEARQVWKSYVHRRRRLHVLRGIDFAVRTAEVACVIGPSGAGKSTLLRVMAGLERPDAGEVLLDGVPVVAGSPRLGVMFQSPLLLPWLRVWENVKFGARFLPSGETSREQVLVMLERVRLHDLADQPVTQLSGGQAQRVALARALIRRPTFLLLDEPFNNLDMPTRRELGAAVRELALNDGVGVLLVTHDIDEALALGDRILVLAPEVGTFAREFAVPASIPARARLRDEILATLKVIGATAILT